MANNVDFSDAIEIESDDLGSLLGYRNELIDNLEVTRSDREELEVRPHVSPLPPSLSLPRPSVFYFLLFRS